MTRQTANLEHLLRQSDWLTRLARALVQDAAQADDLVQEVWLAALENPPTRGRERSWLRSVLKRRRADHYRRESAKSATEEPEAGAATPLEAIETLESHALLGEAVRALAEPYRDAVVARYFLGETPRQIAKRKDVPAATVRSWISRGLDQLRGDLDQRVPGGRSAWALALVPLASRAREGALVTTATTSVLSVAKVLGVVMSQKFIIVGSVTLAGALLWFWSGFVSEGSDGLAGGETEASKQARPAARRSTDESPEATPARPEAQVTGKTETARTLRVVIRDGAGRPVAGARLVLHRGDEILADLRADERGEVETAGARGRCSYVARATNHPCAAGELKRSGQSEIVLPEGAELAGTVTVSGGLPYRELSLHVLLTRSVQPDMPDSVAVLLWPDDTYRGRLTAKVSADGRFSFGGLPEDLGGSIRCAQGFGLASDRKFIRRSVSFERPRTDLHLEILALPRVVGRIVSGVDGEGIPLQKIRISILYGKNAGSTVSARTDAEGRFVLGLNVLEFGQVTLRVPRGGTEIEKTYPGTFRDTLDVGDVVVAEDAAWRFLVVDRDDRPVAGALAAVRGGLFAAPTDEDGHGGIPKLARTIGTIHVGAKGFRTRRVDVTRSVEGRQKIELDRTNGLIVKIATLPEGLKAATVQIAGPLSLLPESFHFDIAGSMAERGSFGVSRGESEAHVEFAADASNVFWIQDLTPGVTFRVEARDADFQVIALLEGIQVGHEERKTVELRFDAGTLKVTRMEFLDALGRPVSEVDVRDAGDESGDSTLTADARGRLNLVRRHDDGGRLRISKEGFEPVLLPVSELPRGPFRLTLEKKP